MESRLLTLGIAIILLVAGRRLYWLLVGLVGFVLGFQLTAQILVAGPQWAMLLGGLLAGLVASVLAVFFQKVALVVAGLFIGAYAVYWWMMELGWASQWWVWLPIVAAGIAGACLTRVIFEAALVLLSSALGATMALEALPLPPHQAGVLFVVLVIFGIVVQFASARRRSE